MLLIKGPEKLGDSDFVAGEPATVIRDDGTASGRPGPTSCCTANSTFFWSGISKSGREPTAWDARSASIWSFKELLGMISPNCRKCEQTGVQWLNSRAGSGSGPDREAAMEHSPAVGSRLASVNCIATAPVTVLIVEDDEIVRELGVELLSDAGFQVLEASNGKEALSLLESNSKIGVLFTDINMPGSLDGITLASIAAVKWPHLAIIIGSGNVLPRSDGLPSGITFIRKPCDPESVIQLIRERMTTSA